jgi:hypothetical protein
LIRSSGDALQANPPLSPAIPASREANFKGSTARQASQKQTGPRFRSWGA